MSKIEPFEIHVGDDDIAELHKRLDETIWPLPGEHNSSQSHGITLDRMRELAEAWRRLDWKSIERRLNSVPHFKIRIEDIDLHFVHQPSPRPDAIPLILCHGWPGSFHEFVGIIDTLTNPPSGQQAFSLVIPSMPGFVFSSAPSSTSWQMNDTARIYDSLMQRLGYFHYAVQGGDWGSVTARLMGALFPERCVCVHLNFCPAPPPGFGLLLALPNLIDWVPLVPADLRRQVRTAQKYLSEGSGYRAIQGTKPATLAYGLTDSPVGLMAWIGEKFDAWNFKVDGKRPLSDETILTSISLYWFTRSVGTSFLPYKQNKPFESYLATYYLKVPSAHSIFPGEIVRVPDWAVNRTGNFIWRKQAPKGGHFASLEQPELFVDHLLEAMPILWAAAKRAGKPAKL